MDFLGHGVVSSERLAGVFRDVCAVEVEPDGLEFDANSVKAAPIREEQDIPRAARHVDGLSRQGPNPPSRWMSDSVTWSHPGQE